ncbi:MAG: hypothetical protein Q8O22_03825 [Candidatus Omnitrophota bacterium]|nr:hypothetical protein [Candidatus Omnitrophota bacterium]
MIKKFILLFASLFFCLVCAEAALAILGLPRFYNWHSTPPQFSFIGIEDGMPVYVNAPGECIRFVYDGNPRGYFGKDNEVDQCTNSLGWRGPEFSVDKPQGRLRIAFLGDSFTFGEGVRFQDTYPEKVSELLNAKYCRGGFETRPYNASGKYDITGGLYGKCFESYDFGVGGYNSVNELFALEHFALKYNPDIVVLKYDLSEAEPELYAVAPGTQEVQRVPRWYDTDPRLFAARPPESGLYKLRLSRLLWQINMSRKKNAAMVSYYSALYQPESRDWVRSEQALRLMIRICRQKNIPVYVVFFPMLYRLEQYPFADVHSRVGEVVKEEGGVFIDLFPLLKNLRTDKLWVHPTDQHPNEIVHRIAAKAIAEQIN